jgi:hypothetical protein
MHIACSVHDALQRLYTEESRMLWVGAICINQDDLQEKVHPVTSEPDLWKPHNVIVGLGGDDAYARTRALLMQDGKNRLSSTLPEAELREHVMTPWRSRV